MTIDGKVQPKAFISLKSLCEEYDFSYSTASKGSLECLKDGKLYRITDCTVYKIAGRGRKDFGEAVKRGRENLF